MFGQGHTRYPIDLDGTASLSIPQSSLLGIEYPKMIDRESEIIFSTTAIALHASAELIQMNIPLHVIQI
jgi:hypothetical protein